uniref:Uncharacterized protein n=1 Tax=Arundo donax TaxID=35708 RepID=A0A0A8ZSQ1_ARUDO
MVPKLPFPEVCIKS